MDPFVGLLVSGGVDLPPEAWYWIVTLGAAAGAAASFPWAFRSLRRARLIEDTPTAKIASAPQGHVELSGTGGGTEPGALACPLTGTPCLWYSYKVEVKQRVQTSRGEQTRWVTVEHGKSQRAFWLVDGTGRCLVHPAGAEVVPGRRAVWHGNSPRSSPPQPGFSLGIGSSFRYTEELITPEEPLYALGWFETIRAERRAEDEVNAKLRELKGDRKGLLERFDGNKDGEIDLDEWDAARSAVLQEVLEIRAKRPPEEDCNTLTIPADPELPFIIGGQPQAAIAGKYRRRAALGIVLFLACGALSVAAGGHREFFTSRSHRASR